jgi:O-antigen ligase
MLEHFSIGTIVALGVVLFLIASVAIALFPKLFHAVVAIGIVLLSFVFVEPSPSDLVLAAAIPLGLITGTYKPKASGKGFIAILIFSTYCLVSLPGIAFVEDLAFSLRYYAITFYLFLIAVFLATYSCSDNILSLLRAYIVSAFISFLAGLAGYLGVFSEYLMADQFRVKGLFKDPNVFGPFFVPAILLLIEDSRRRAIFKVPPYIHWAVVGLFSLGVVFSFSRAAWLNLMASVMAYFVLNINQFRSTQILRMLIAILIIVLILVGILLSPLLSDTGIADFLQERAQLQKYDSERFNAHHGGWELVKENPFGYGPGQFQYKIVDVIYFRIDAHSLYVRTAVEDGVLGFLLFLGGLAYILLTLYFQHRSSSTVHRNQVSPSIVIAILCGILVNSMVVDTIHWRHFWFFIGVGIYSIQEARKELEHLWNVG